MPFENWNNHPTVGDRLSSQEEEGDDEDDALSFCDLPLNDAVRELNNNSEALSSYQEDEDRLFEFVVTPKPLINDDSKPITAAGKFISSEQKTPFISRSDRFSSRAVPNAMNARLRHTSSMKSYATRQQQHATKHVVMFGKASIPREMGLSDIRKRQGRRTPAPLFPAADERQLGISVDGRGKGKGRWGLFRSLFSRSTSSSRSSGFGSALARSSISCMSIV